MKAKRAKQYRKLMQQYGLTFGFREPYQVLVDAQMLQDADRFKMDIVKGLERTLSGKVKPMITQCSIRHLYTATPKNDALIERAKTFERRRCNHHLLEEPLSTMECLSSVIDPKDQHANKYNYVVASQDDRVRAMMRSIPGVPLIYIKRSVMILEPMAGASENVKSKEERGKFKLGISRTGGRASVLGKRSREDGDTEGTRSEHGVGDVEGSAAKKKRGVREPNPLSMRKPKARETSSTTMASPSSMAPSVIDEGVGKKKRKRKHKDRSEAGANGVTATAGDMSDG